MAQFYNDYFSFDGVYSRKYGYKLITLDNGFESIFGLDKNINKEKGVNGEDVYYGESNNNITLTISFCKVDEFNSPLTYTKEELRFITSWLFNKKDYLPFECDGLIYYVKFIKGTRWDNFSSKGYITVEMDVLNGIAYEPVKEIELEVGGGEYLYLYNDSTATDVIFPNYEVILNEETIFSITNETTNQIVEFLGLPVGEKILIDNNIKDMKSELDINKNIYKFSNKQWLYLTSGLNVLKIDCADCNFKIRYQNKICLM